MYHVKIIRRLTIVVAKLNSDEILYIWGGKIQAGRLLFSSLIYVHTNWKYYLKCNQISSHRTDADLKLYFFGINYKD